MRINFYQPALMARLLKGPDRATDFKACVAAGLTADGAMQGVAKEFVYLKRHYSLHPNTAPSPRQLIQVTNLDAFVLTEYPCKDLIEEVKHEYQLLTQKNMMVEISRTGEVAPEKFIELAKKLASLSPVEATPLGLGERPGASVAQSIPEADDFSYIFQSGISVLDGCTGGLKRGELWGHLAPTGGLKSTFAMNWIYNVALADSDRVILYFNLEMKEIDVRRTFVTLHSTHAEFAQDRAICRHEPTSGLSLKALQGSVDYVNGKAVKVVNTADENAFVVTAEESSNKVLNNVKLYCLTSTEDEYPNVSVIEAAAYDVLRKHGRCDFIVVDHSDLIGATKGKEKKEDYARTLDAIQRLSVLSQKFNDQRGVAILLCIQSNGTGTTEAGKQDKMGKPPTFTTSNVAQGTATSRPLDHLSTSYSNDRLGEAGVALFSLIKARTGKQAAPFLVDVDCNTRKIRDRPKPFDLTSVYQPVVGGTVIDARNQLRDGLLINAMKILAPKPTDEVN